MVRRLTMLLTALAVLAPAASQAYISRELGVSDWKAQWIWIEGEPSPRNSYVYFRRYLTLPAGVRKGAAAVCADSRYQLFINGKRIGRGPIRSDPRWQCYDVYDNLEDYLRPGKNVIAALVHHYGETTFQYIPGRGGFLFQAELELYNGETFPVLSDESWRALPAEAWRRELPRMDLQLAFPEVYDARMAPQRWTQVRFRDDGWAKATVLGRPPMPPWTRLEPNPLPFMAEEEIAPVRVLEVGEAVPQSDQPDNVAQEMERETHRSLETYTVLRPEGVLERGDSALRIVPGAAGSGVYLVLDFGREVTGYPRIRLDAEEPGGVVDLGYAEALDGGRVNPHRHGVRYADRYVFRKGRQEWETFDKRAFRYLQLSFRDLAAPVEVDFVGLNFSTYPVEYRGSFECSDERLNQIWKTGAYTTQLNMEDAFTDCPWRERGQWWGDARVEALVSYYTFGDARLMRRGLISIGQSQERDGITAGIYPTAFEGRRLPSFTLIWILSLDEYYLHTGDLDLVRELYPKVRRALAWFQPYEDAHHLLKDVPHWVFIDWADLDQRGEVAALNAFYVAALRAAADLADHAGQKEHAAAYRERAGRVGEAFQQRFWSDTEGAFVDCYAEGGPSQRVSQQTNALAVLYDLAPPQKRQQVLDRILDPQKPTIQVGSPYFSFYLTSALYHAGRHQQALDYIRERWGRMLDQGATTWWEMWTPSASLCHGWSAGPTVDLMAQVLGVRPLQPGYRTYLVQPRRLGLRYARGKVPSVAGPITVQWRQDPKRGFTLEVEGPAQTIARVGLPLDGFANPSVSLDGDLLWSAGGGVAPRRVAALSREGDTLWVEVPSGKRLRFGIAESGKD